MVILTLSLSFCLSSLSIFASVSPTIPLSLSLSVRNFACRRKLNWNAENIAKKELVTCVSQAPAAEVAASRAKSKSIAEISWPETPLLKLLLLLLLCCMWHAVKVSNYTSGGNSVNLASPRCCCHRYRRRGTFSLLSDILVKVSITVQKIFEFSDCLWFALLLCSRVCPPAFRQIQHNPHVTHSATRRRRAYCAGHCDKLPPPPPPALLATLSCHWWRPTTK